MKAFVIWQPWASLVMTGAKPYEFRTNSYLNPRSYRNAPVPGDRIVISAGARSIKPQEVQDVLDRLDSGESALRPDLARPLLERLLSVPKCRGVIPMAAALGTVVIGEPILACDLFKLDVSDSDRGDFNWAWPLTDIKVWDEPIPCRGLQGFWDFPFAVPA